MAEDKKMSFATSVEAVPAPGLARTIQKFQKEIQAAGNMDHMFKNMDKWIKKDKELAKTMKEHSNKVLMEKDKLLTSINKKVEHSAKLHANAEKAAERLTRLQMRAVERSMGVEYGFMRGGTMAQQAQAQNLANIQNRAMGNMQAGSEILANNTMDQQQQIAASRQQTLARGAAWLQAASGVAGIVEDVFGWQAAKAANQANAAGVAGRLYTEIGQNDYSSLWAIRRSMGGVRSITDAADSAGIMNLIKRGLGGAGTVLGGAALAGVGTLMLPTGLGTIPGGVMVGAGAGVMASGASTLAGVVGSAVNEEIAARQAAAASQAIDSYGRMNPIKRAQFEALASRTTMMGDLGNLSGGIGKNAWVGLSLAGAQGGLTDHQTMPLWMALRQGLGTSGAWDNLSTATQSLKNWGMDRNTAVSALVAAGSMAPGASASHRVNQMLLRAGLGGVSDTMMQGALVNAMPGMMASVAGRAGDVGMMTERVADAAQGAGGGMAGLNVAIQGAALQGSVFGTNGPTQAINVAQSGNIYRVAAKYGISGTLTKALVDIGDWSKIEANTSIMGAIGRELANNRQSISAQDFVNEIKSGAVATHFAMFGREIAESPEGAGVLIGRLSGGTRESYDAALRQALYTTGSGDVSGTAGIPKSGDQADLDELASTNAANSIRAAMQALNDPDAISTIKDLAVAGAALSNAFDQMSDAQLRDVPGLLDAVAFSLQKVGAAARAAGFTPTPPLPPLTPSTPASTTSPHFTTASGAAVSHVPGGGAFPPPPPVTTSTTR